MKYVLILCLSLVFLTSCFGKSDSKEGQTSNDAQKLVNEIVKAHGGNVYETAAFSFMFRDRIYTFKK